MKKEELVICICMCIGSVIALGAFISICRKGIKELGNPLHRVREHERIECGIIDVIPEQSLEPSRVT